MSEIRSVAVIGAGIAGLACAAGLRAGGLAVSLYDKGRRPGGRVATRRADGLLFDHGAQYATARDPDFLALIRRMHDSGAAARWPEAEEGGEARWVGTPGMSALPRFMADQLAADGVTIATERHVGFLHGDGAAWRVRHLPAADIRPGTVTETGGSLDGPFDAVIVALPSPQAAPLLRPLDDALPAAPLSARLAACTIAPCWSVMAAFETRIDAPDAARHREGPLAWNARDSSRPGRAASPDTWMLHASADWSRANLERAAPEVAADLLGAFLSATGAGAAATIHLSGHRWRYALVETPLGEPCLWDATRRIGVCGDWCLGPRVEAAYQSGAALASRLLSST